MKKFIGFVVIFCFLLCCDKPKSLKANTYENQIGDTSFNPNLDNRNFKLCDSTQVLHKRALVKYKGGTKALENDLISQFNYKSKYQSFNGYFFIRFVVNCNDETGRFRMQILDQNFKSTNCPKELEIHILKITKALKNWNHAFYKGKAMDCYRFLIIKMEKGKIIKA
ncbi:hypothetical protein BFR04_03575 [Gaetbulibacter sp. 4G1]|nr:hypothetical protein [Gaetbulibacter sp. 4G1]PIA78626.1 hypothetical protein BFR04_03575 [Gaetbulibacter sp. 4G1]